ncbi:MAG: Sorbitol dehydrogenase [Alphaproteobacteria bacterium MarineAlpha4_Bin2]|nr:MAG: Sorbitol dehydrogenase [Alphaproteobacteria bacterium MarineAlpha4_Bin2]
MEGLKDRVVVVTGVGRPRGIGRATAIRFAAAGAKLVLADLATGDRAVGDIEGTSPDLEVVAREVADEGGEAISIAVDVSKEADVERLIGSTLEAYGRIDTMVANAAILTGKGDPLDITLDTFMRIQAVNVAGVFLCLREAVRQMLKQGPGGSIVTVGSRASRRGDANIAAYSASKFGVVGLTQSFAMAYAKNGIRINCVCPGAVDTEMYVRQTNDFAARKGVDFDTAKRMMGDVIPLGRLTTGEDVAKAIVWMASDEASHVTGQAFNVNGGSWMN